MIVFRPSACTLDSIKFVFKDEKYCKGVTCETSPVADTTLLIYYNHVDASVVRYNSCITYPNLARDVHC